MKLGNKDIFFALTIAVLVVIIWFKSCNRTSPEAKLNEYLQQQKDSIIKVKTDSLALFPIVYDSLYKVNDSLQKLIKANEKDIQIIWLDKHIKDSIIDSYSIGQLRSEITNGIDKRFFGLHL